MIRSTFKQRQSAPKQDRTSEFATWVPRPREIAVAVAWPALATVAMPKPEKAMPGRRRPTVEESAWMAAITAIGCIACLIDGHPGTPGAVHHILRSGQRIGHLHSICLCDPGHHQNGQQRGMVSRHPWKARFEDRYGSEESLINKSIRLVNGNTLLQMHYNEAPLTPRTNNVLP